MKRMGLEMSKPEDRRKIFVCNETNKDCLPIEASPLVRSILIDHRAFADASFVNAAQHALGVIRREQM